MYMEEKHLIGGHPKYNLYNPYELFNANERIFINVIKILNKCHVNVMQDKFWIDNLKQVQCSLNNYIFQNAKCKTLF